VRGGVGELREGGGELMVGERAVADKGERWRILAKAGYTAEQIEEAIRDVLFVFGRMEQELSERGPWLAGATFSLGDINMASIVHRTFELYPDKIGRPAFSPVNDCYNRLMPRPPANFLSTPRPP